MVSRAGLPGDEGSLSLPRKSALLSEPCQLRRQRDIEHIENKSDIVVGPEFLLPLGGQSTALSC